MTPEAALAKAQECAQRAMVTAISASQHNHTSRALSAVGQLWLGIAQEIQLQPTAVPDDDMVSVSRTTYQVMLAIIIEAVAAGREGISNQRVNALAGREVRIEQHSVDGYWTVTVRDTVE